MSDCKTFRTKGIVVLLSGLLLAACSQRGFGSSSIPPATQPNREVTSAGSKLTLYVQLLHGNGPSTQSAILGYHPRHGSFAKSQPFCNTQDLGFATGIATDADGKLYVSYSTPNSSGFGAAPYYIDVFQPHCGAQIAQISDQYITAGDPRQIAFGNGQFYVGNQYGSGDGSANIAVCSLSKKKCLRKLTGSGSSTLSAVIGVAVDSSGNVYGGGYLANSIEAGIVEWAGGKGTGRIVAQLSSTGYEDFVGSMLFDNQGNLLTSSGDELDVFTGCPNACVQTATLALKNPESQYFALSSDNSTLYVVSSEGYVDVYTYDAGKSITYEYSLTNGLSHSAYPYGLALHK